MAAASGVFRDVCSEEPPYHTAEELWEGLKQGDEGAQLLFVFFLRLRKSEQTRCCVEKAIAAEGKRWVGVLIEEAWCLYLLMRHRAVPHQGKPKSGVAVEGSRAQRRILASSGLARYSAPSLKKRAAVRSDCHATATSYPRQRRARPGAAPGVLSQEWRANPHHNHQQTPARTGGGPPTTTGSGPQRGVAGHRNQNPQPGGARDQSPPQTADPSQEWRGTAPRTLSEERRGTTHNTHQPHPHKHQPQAPTKRGGDKQQKSTDTPETSTHAHQRTRRTHPHHTTTNTDTRNTQNTPKHEHHSQLPAPQTHSTQENPHPIPTKQPTNSTTAGGPQPGVAGNRNQDPQPGVARDHPQPPTAEPSQEWRGTALKTPSQEWRGTGHKTHHPHPHKHQQQAPAQRGGAKQPKTTDPPHAHTQPHKRTRKTHEHHTTHTTTNTDTRNTQHTRRHGHPAHARCHKHTQHRTPPTTTAAGGPQPELAGNCNQYPQPGVGRDHTPRPSADPSQEWRGTAPGALSQEWRGITHKQRHRTPARSCREPHPGPTARSGEGPPTTTTSGPQPGISGNHTQAPQPGVARGQQPPPPPDLRQEWWGTAPRTLSQEWQGTTHHHNHRAQARSCGEIHPSTSARSGEGLPTTTTSGPQQ